MCQMVGGPLATGPGTPGGGAVPGPPPPGGAGCLSLKGIRASGSSVGWEGLQGGRPPWAGCKALCMASLDVPELVRAVASSARWYHDRDVFLCELLVGRCLWCEA